MTTEPYLTELGRAELRRKDRREALLKEYGEIAANFRTLTDIRFRLLALLPIAAAAAAAFKPEGTPVGRIPFALFGLAVTLGLITYNKRNDQLYDELIGRAGSIEREIGIPDGAFANRPNDWLAFWLGTSWAVNHRRAIAIIYFATISFWLFMALEGAATVAALLPPGQALYAQFKALLPEVWDGHTGGIVRGVIFLVSVLLPLLVLAGLRKQEKTRRDEVSTNVSAAGKLLFAAEQTLLDGLDGIQKSRPAVIAVPTRALLSKLRDNTDFINACAIARKKRGDRDSDTRKTIKDHMGANFEDAPSSGSVAESDPARAAHVLSVIVGLPPRYVRAKLPSRSITRST